MPIAETEIAAVFAVGSGRFVPVLPSMMHACHRVVISDNIRARKTDVISVSRTCASLARSAPVLPKNGILRVWIVAHVMYAHARLFDGIQGSIDIRLSPAAVRTRTKDIWRLRGKVSN